MTIINALPFNLQNGTTADATQVMADFNEIVNDVNNNAAHNGVNTDITALTGLVTPITPAQGGSTVFYGAGSGTANAQTVPSVAPTGFALTVGWSIYWVPANQNTGALTLSVNGGAATAVLVQTESGPQPCIGGEVIGGQLTKATFDGTEFILDMDMMVGFGTLATLASATTTDIGTARSHTVNISGTTTITAFGSSALLARPLYKLVFSGALVLTYNATSLILPGSANITTANGDSADALYLGSGNWQIISYYKRTGVPVNFNATFIQNYLTGYTLAAGGGNNGTFFINPGEATDVNSTIVMLLNSQYSKTTASWAVGSGNGALDTGAIANTTWYHVFAIIRPDTGVVDILFSLSPTSPTLPTNYTTFRRIGSMKTDASAHWLPFTQTGDVFTWAISVTDVSAIATTASRVSKVLSTPTGITTSALFRAGMNVAGAATTILFTSLLETDQAPGATGGFGDLATGTNSTNGDFERLTDTSSQIGVRSTNTGGIYSIFTYGWKDTRGKN